MLIANECVHPKYKDKKSGLLCKLAIEKAYDGVDWVFFMYILRRMGFGVKWRSWIHECISSAWFSILINGTPKGFFRAKKGLRQGDPLSPFLFIIVGEAFSRMVLAVGNANIIQGFQLTREAPTFFPPAICG